MKRFLHLILIINLFLLGAVFLFFLTPDGRAILRTPSYVQHNDDSRPYIISNPSEEQQPLVIVLHGFKDHAKLTNYYSGFSHLAKQEGFTVVFPYGMNRSWNGAICCGSSWRNEVDDVGFIQSLITEVTNNHAIDMDRIYLVGFSNGGVMAQHLVNELPDTFAAAVSIMNGAGDGTTLMDISQASTPLFLVQADQDVYVPISEPYIIDAYQFIPAEQTRDIWREQLGNPSLLSETSTERYTQLQYGSEDGVTLQYRMYNNQRHLWPDLKINPFSRRAPESTRDMWEFLKNQIK